MDVVDEQRRIKHRLSVLGHAEEVSGNVAGTGDRVGFEGASDEGALELRLVRCQPAAPFVDAAAGSCPCEDRLGVWIDA